MGHGEQRSVSEIILNAGKETNNQKHGDHENVKTELFVNTGSATLKKTPVAWSEAISVRNAGRNKFEFSEKQYNSVVISDRINF